MGRLGASWRPRAPAMGEGTGVPLAVLGPSWEPLAGLFPSAFAFWAPFWTVVEPFRAVLVPFWAVFWAVLRASSPLRALFGASFGPLRRLLRPSWSSLGALLGRLGAFLGPLGPSWDDMWGLLGRLGQFLARKAENPKNHQKRMANQYVLPPEALSGVLLEASWPSRGPLGPS